MRNSLIIHYHGEIKYSEEENNILISEDDSWKGEFINKQLQIDYLKIDDYIIKSKIVNQELRLIADRLSERGIELNYSPSVKKYIFNELKEKNSHARQIKNLVKTLVQIPLSTFIVENRGIEKISLKVVDKTLSFA